VNYNRFIKIVKNQWRLVLAMVIIVFIVSLILSLLQTPLYRTSAEVLVIPNSAATVDAYTAAKSAEQLALTFAGISYTNSFMDSVLARSSIQLESLNTTDWQKKKNWKKIIDTKVVDDTGFLQINVYAPDKKQSALLSRAVTSVLTDSGTDYLGSDTAASIKIIDGPVTYDRVAKPNLPLNLTLGAILGLLAGFGLAYLFPQESRLDLLYPFQKQSDHKIEREQIFPITQEAIKDSVEMRFSDSKEEDNTNKLEKETSPVSSGIGAPPMGLPVIENQKEKNTTQFPKVVTEGEKIEISPEERATHWLETGRLDK
jgi:capsular polysaccharide biosynthesis protein